MTGPLLFSSLSIIMFRALCTLYASWHTLCSKSLKHVQHINMTSPLQVFEGNSDQETVVTHELTQPVITQFIRVNPKTWNEQIALRAELYGFDAGSGQTSTVVGNT